MNRVESREYAKQNQQEIVEYVLSHSKYQAVQHFGLKSTSSIDTLLWRTGHKDKVTPSFAKRRGGFVTVGIKHNTKVSIYDQDAYWKAYLTTEEGHIAAVKGWAYLTDKIKEQEKLITSLESDKLALLEVNKRISNELESCRSNKTAAEKEWYARMAIKAAQKDVLCKPGD